MPTDVIMPQMGESIFEGTITKWLKKVGDSVQRDEPLFEISTDKVDAEIPSPAAGVLSEIKVAEGTTVQVNTVVATLGEASGDATGIPAPAATTSAPAEPPESDATAAVAPPAPAPPAPALPAPALPVDTSSAAPAAPAGSETNVVMPQMGESIFEGTLTRWLKKVGDTVQRDEPLFEISTDKVDAEIPSPAAGILTEIKVPEGTTVQTNTVVAVLGGSGTGSSGTGGSGTSASQPVAEAKTEAPAPSAAQVPPPPQATAAGESHEGVRSSPLVRSMAKDNNIDLRQIKGSGSAGRITKEDVLGFLAQPAASKPAPPPPIATVAPGTQPAAPVPAAPAPASASAPATGDPASRPDLVPLTRMRSIIAQRMVESKRTSPHVHSCFKIDLTRIVRLREKEKSKYEQRNGVKLTYMPFITRAVIATLRKMPIVNASIEGEGIRYHQNVNIGIAVALEWGLIVPVIRQAEEKSFLGVARAIADLADRARNKKLKPEEVGSGTFTITNPGIFGEQFGTPIINQPESAILDVGGLFKEPTVVTDESGSDSIAIRSIIRLTLGFDHRIVDGADAGRFMAEVKKYLENWNEDIG